MYPLIAMYGEMWEVWAGATENARHENASKNQKGLRKKIFIRSTALYVFDIGEPFITTKTKCLLYYSSIPLNEQAAQATSYSYCPFWSR